MSASFRAAIAYSNSTRESTHYDTDPLSPGLHSFSTGYNKLTYTIFGTGPSLVVCQVPGWGIGPSYISNGLAPLHGSLKILYFTPRGTPPSSRPLDASEMSSKHMVEDLEILRQYLKLGSMLLLGHSNGGSIVLGYAQQYPSHVEKLVLIDHELQGFDDSATYIEFAMKRKDDHIYGAALERLQSFKADTNEEMQEGLNGILPFYFANPTESVPKMLETMEDMPSSWALNHQRAADRERPTYLVDDLNKVEATTLIVVGRDDPFCSVKAAEKTHAGMATSELVILEDCGHFAWIENRECLDVVSRFLRE
ncbi:MAG: hypothetical protein ASARMPREDX12_009431 [Alectoria sarmentosa]|nr:MAG: hypothetical protein ASARMPREDX12_009431 [Alectoria sarmentosa]